MYVTRLCEKMSEKFQNKVYSHTVVRFLEKEIDVDDAIKTLTQYDNKEVVNAYPHFVHIDITPAVSAVYEATLHVLVFMLFTVIITIYLFQEH